MDSERPSLASGVWPSTCYAGRDEDRPGAERACVVVKALLPIVGADESSLPRRGFSAGAKAPNPRSTVLMTGCRSHRLLLAQESAAASSSATNAGGVP